MKFQDQLKKLDACSSVVDWLIRETNPKVSLPMRKKLVLCVCDIAETSLKYVPKGEARPALAIETARRWAQGEKVTIKEVKTAANADKGASHEV